MVQHGGALSENGIDGVAPSRVFGAPEHPLVAQSNAPRRDENKVSSTSSSNGDVIFRSSPVATNPVSKDIPVGNAHDGDVAKSDVQHSVAKNGHHISPSLAPRASHDSDIDTTLYAETSQECTPQEPTTPQEPCQSVDKSDVALATSTGSVSISFYLR